MNVSHIGKPGSAAPDPIDPPMDTDSIELRIAEAVVAMMRQESTCMVGEALDMIEQLLLPRHKPGYQKLNRYALARCRAAIGDVRICDLGPVHAQRLWAALEGPSLGAFAGALKPRLREADDLGEFVHDGKRYSFRGLAKFVKLLPDTPPSRRRNLVVTDEIHREALVAIDWARERTRVSAQTLRFIDVAVRSPFRLEELAALQRADVDFRARAALLRDSKTGARPVPLSSRSCELLREQIASNKPGEEYVFPSLKSMSGHATGRCCSKAWLRIRTSYCEEVRTEVAADLSRVVFHGLRHFICTQALAHGVAVADVQRALGHSTTTMVDRYGHWVGCGLAAVDLVESVLDGTKEEKDRDAAERKAAVRWDGSCPPPTGGWVMVDAQVLASVICTHGGDELAAPPMQRVREPKRPSAKEAG